MTDWYTATTEHPYMIAQAPAEVPAAHTEVPAPAEEHGEAAESQWDFYWKGSFIALIVIIVLALIGMRRKLLVPKGLQTVMEMLVDALYGIPQMVMGPRGSQYAPFLATLFIYILVMNLLGLVPWVKAGTASLSITLGMALVAFVAVQYFGFRAHGIRYLAHFLGPVPFMAILILPLELLSEVIRPVSLSVRLYGNIFGEEQVIASLAHMNPLVAVVMLPLQILTCVLQAFVFTLLVTVYISLATEKHGEGDEEAHAH
jgi:F-type H+-transporting ATPase subunit a